jgi:hypothetical protein
MKKINLFIPLHTLPSIQSYKTIDVENLLSTLRTKANVHVTWLVYQADKIESAIQNKSDETILDIHNYSNAVEILQDAKPDLIYAAASWDLIDYSFSSAAKFLNIPVFGDFRGDPGLERSTSTLIKFSITRFFENSTPTDTTKNKKRFMRRGSFFMFKYFFMFKSLNATNLNIFQSIQKCCLVLKLLLTNESGGKDGSNSYDSRFANTIHCLGTESLVEPLIKSGFDKSSLIVTGNPMYDAAFKTINQFESLKKQNKIRILLITSTQYEHGFWSKKQRDFVVGETIKKIFENKNKFELTVKIHPSTSSLADYESLIHPISPSIKICQTGNFLDFLNNADVVITQWNGSAEAYTILAKKPLIFCNFFDEYLGVILERGLAIECKEPSSLIESIEHAIISNPATEQKYQKYVEEVIGKWDGKASERISNAILNLLEKS